MRKLLFITALTLSSLYSFSQTTKPSKQPNTPKQEVKATDSLITIKFTKQQVQQIQDILQSAGQSISKSNLPINEGLQAIQGLNAIVSFFKQYEQPKKDK